MTLLVLLTAFAAAVAAAHIWRVGPATVAKVHVQRHAKHAKRHSKKRRHRRPHQVARKRVGPGTVGSGGGGGPSSAEGSSGAGAGGGPGSSGGPSEAGSSSTPAGGSPGGDPFAGQTFYVEPGSAAAQTQQEWAGQGRAAEAAQVAKIASQPVAKWFGDWSYGHGGTQGDVGWWVGRATAAGALPVLVAYDLPWRDCSQFSSGGASSPTAYREFIAAMAAGIGTHQAVVILEPDALAELSCLSGEQQSTYYSLLSGAVAMLSAHAGVTVYLDAGNAHWEPAATIASRLEKAGVAGARGFSLNVSNFDATSSEVAYGEAVVHDIGASGASPHFIVDTSRNGRGAPSGGEWCNPPGRGLGADPTASTGNPLVDAFFWVKSPGQSDGNCNGGPNAGEFWPAYALELARNSAG
ncbi:MAG TPA: glycoside hydrolase family 6 protein [Solirubrobacteraceae bacterium]